MTNEPIIASLTNLASDSKQRRQRVSTVELFSALEALLPFAQIEIECASDYVRTFPDDPDHAEDVEKVRSGMEALKLAERLIARKTANIRQRQRAFERAHLDAASEGDGAAVTTDEAAAPAADSAGLHGE